MSLLARPRPVPTLFLLVVHAIAAAACGGDVREDDGSGGAGSGGASATGTSTTTGSTSTTTGSTGSTSTGAGPSFAACDAPGTCVFTWKGCCHPCFEVALSDVDAIHEGAVEDHFDAVCPVPEGCAECGWTENPDLFAYCDIEAEACVGADITTHELGACEAASDCVLRDGLGCCDGCGEVPAESWVALRGDAQGTLATLVCREGEGCDACSPEPPLGIAADCVAGQCVVVPLVGQ